MKTLLISVVFEYFYFSKHVNLYMDVFMTIHNRILKKYTLIEEFQLMDSTEIILPTALISNKSSF